MGLRNSNPGTHLKTAGTALLNWWRAATLDALIVGVLWFIGLELIRVPWAPFWAILGGLLQLVPTFGGMIALIGPVISVAVTTKDDDWWRSLRRGAVEAARAFTWERAATETWAVYRRALGLAPAAAPLAA